MSIQERHDKAEHTSRDRSPCTQLIRREFPVFAGVFGCESMLRCDSPPRTQLSWRESTDFEEVKNEVIAELMEENIRSKKDIGEL